MRKKNIQNTSMHIDKTKKSITRKKEVHSPDEKTTREIVIAAVWYEVYKAVTAIGMITSGRDTPMMSKRLEAKCKNIEICIVYKRYTLRHC